MAYVWCRFKSVLAAGTGPRPCLVNLYPDGSVLVMCAGTEMGQGLFTKAKQVGHSCLNCPSHTCPGLADSTLASVASPAW